VPNTVQTKEVCGVEIISFLGFNHRNFRLIYLNIVSTSCNFNLIIIG